MLSKLKSLVSGLKSFVANFKAKASKDLSELWKDYKGFLIVFGALILTLKFRELLVSFLLNSSKRFFQGAQKKSASLDLKENKDDAQSNALVEQAQDLPKTEQPVTVDWYKDKK